jgi:hypothetical protein
VIALCKRILVAGVLAPALGLALGCGDTPPTTPQPNAAGGDGQTGPKPAGSNDGKQMTVGKGITKPPPGQLPTRPNVPAQ